MKGRDTWEAYNLQKTCQGHIKWGKPHKPSDYGWPAWNRSKKLFSDISLAWPYSNFLLQAAITSAGRWIISLWYWRVFFVLVQNLFNSLNRRPRTFRFQSLWKTRQVISHWCFDKTLSKWDIVLNPVNPAEVYRSTAQLQSCREWTFLYED